jgi:hypothetical protein
MAFSGDGYGGSNENHPLELGTYQDGGPPICGICNQPVSGDDRVDAGEFSYVHRGCRDTAKVEFKYLTLDDEPVPTGHCVVPDHRETVLTVTIRTIGALPVDQVYHLIQQKFEVVNIKPVGGTIWVK